MRTSSTPDESNWRFSEIARFEQGRASRLERAGTPDELVNAVLNRFAVAARKGDVRFGRDCDDTRGGRRAIIQFPVGMELFDWFFNARSGYRAHFRMGVDCGLNFNDRVIDAVRQKCDQLHPAKVAGREFKGQFEDCGPVEVPKTFLLASLVPRLSQVWMCTKRICPCGGVETLPPNVGGEPNILTDTTPWPSMYRDEVDAWLDVKGAFIGTGPPYQPKDFMVHAETLHVGGTA